MEVHCQEIPPQAETAAVRESRICSAHSTEDFAEIFPQLVKVNENWVIESGKQILRT